MNDSEKEYILRGLYLLEIEMNYAINHCENNKIKSYRESQLIDIINLKKKIIDSRIY